MSCSSILRMFITNCIKNNNQGYYLEIFLNLD